MEAYVFIIKLITKTFICESKCIRALNALRDYGIADGAQQSKY